MSTHGIPTKYAGIQFRSRAEARWAAFFDRLDWRWAYEPVDLDGYIPDFVLEGRCYTEVKGGVLNHEQVCAMSKTLHPAVELFLPAHPNIGGEELQIGSGRNPLEPWREPTHRGTWAGAYVDFCIHEKRIVAVKGWVPHEECLFCGRETSTGVYRSEKKQEPLETSFGAESLKWQVYRNKRAAEYAWLAKTVSAAWTDACNATQWKRTA